MAFVIRSLLKSLLVLAVAVSVMALLPLAAVAMTRTPGGAVVWFFLGPLSAGFYAMLYATLSAVPWRKGAAAVRRHREERGGLWVASARATAWLFGSIILSFAAEFALVFAGIHSRSTLPLATYTPLLFAWVWRKARG
jgi:hypothetical protein